MIKRFLATAMLATVSSFAFAQMPVHEAVPGKTYALIDPPAQRIRTSDPNKVEVVGVFSYTCGHCYRLEEPIKKWLSTKSEDIDFVRLPMPGSGLWELYSKTYFTLEAIKAEDIGHAPFFDAIMKERKSFKSPKDIAEFMASLGINKDEFLKAWDSFAVKTNFNRAVDLTVKQYKIDYTPLFIIDGKYLVDGTTSQAQSYEGIMDAVNELALKLLEEKKQADTATP